jgi:protein-disulfide isomerase
MTEKCEKCGKEFDSERGLHIHQAQKHEDEDTESAEETSTTENQDNNLNQGQQGLNLNIKQVGYGSFAVGLLTGLLLGALLFGGTMGNMETTGLPSPSDTDGAPSEDNGDSGSNVVELSNTEFPYENLEAGVGEGERTFGDMTINVDGEPYIGSPDAEVTAVSYEDFECPFCSRYNNDAYPQIVENYVQTGDVQYFYKNLPLPQLGHAWAEPSAIASECALNQDEESFWTFKAGFFNNQDALGNAQDNGNFDESMYRWAEQTGLDTDQFKTCYDNEEELDEVNQDKQEASNNGASATPSIFINDELIEGAQPYSRFESVIESKLG